MINQLSYEEREILKYKSLGYDEGYKQGFDKGKEISELKKDIDFIHECLKNKVDIKTITKIIGKDIKDIISKAKYFELI